MENVVNVSHPSEITDVDVVKNDVVIVGGASVSPTLDVAVMEQLKEDEVPTDIVQPNLNDPRIKLRLKKQTRKLVQEIDLSKLFKAITKDTLFETKATTFTPRSSMFYLVGETSIVARFFKTASEATQVSESYSSTYEEQFAVLLGDRLIDAFSNNAKLVRDVNLIM